VARRRYFSDYGRAPMGRSASPNIAPYLVIAVLALLGLLLTRVSPPATAINFSGRVVDSFTGRPVAGAAVMVLAAGPDRTPAPAGADLAIVNSQPVTVAGISTATQQASLPPVVLTTTTGVDGLFTLTNLSSPPPMLLIEQDGYAPLQVSAAGPPGADVRLVPDTVHGKVTDGSGQPVSAATVSGGGQIATTDTDGAYTIKGVGADHHLTVKAPGFKLAHIEFGATTEQNVTLTAFSARAIYVNADSLASSGKLYSLIKIATDTEINAMVIDVKADTTGYVLYKSALPQVQAAGAVNPIIGDLRDLIATLHKNGIYVIARQALFWDEKLAAAHPDWAIKSKSTGGAWQDAYGHHWVNPYLPDVWAYNIAIAKEVASLGADEIQFDYVRFPSDGQLSDAEYGVPDSQSHASAIAAFLKQAHSELSRQGVFIAADVFGLSPIVKDDLGIGQQFDELVKYLDYICPMAYPSHYGRGFLDFDKPAEHPSEVVAYTLQQAQAKMLQTNAKLRPWLQDFTLGGTVYDATRVRGQIDTANAAHTAGWMLWNFENVYTLDALHKGE
jgi:hypothetical protein